MVSNEPTFTPRRLRRCDGRLQSPASIFVCPSRDARRTQFENVQVEPVIRLFTLADTNGHFRRHYPSMLDWIGA
jgi:hypothetical protein